jgi:hypothetical protein
MKQVLQSLRNGITTVAEVPCPTASLGTLLIGSTVSLISAGTERILVDFGRGSLLDKVRQQPDKFRQVMEKMRTDGVFRHPRSRAEQARPAARHRLLHRRAGR